MKMPDTPDIRAVCKAVLAGERVPNEILFWVLGRHLSCHPVYMLTYARSGDPRVLCPSEMFGSSTGYSGNRKAVQFETFAWRPVLGDAEARSHLVCACPSCPTNDGPPDVTRSQRCPNPQTLATTVVRKVTWAELGRFLQPGFTDDLLWDMGHLMERRRQHTENQVDFGPMKDREKWQAQAQVQTRAWWAIEDEGRALAATAWDAARDASVMSAVLKEAG